jgi:hypothetical protein
MVSSGLLRRVALVRTDDSEEPGASFIRVTKIVFLRSVRRLLVAACVVPSSPIFVTLMKEASGSSETTVLTRATRRNNPEDTILQRSGYLRRHVRLSFCAPQSSFAYHELYSSDSREGSIVTNLYPPWVFKAVKNYLKCVNFVTVTCNICNQDHFTQFPVLVWVFFLRSGVRLGKTREEKSTHFSGNVRGNCRYSIYAIDESDC